MRTRSLLTVFGLLWGMVNATMALGQTDNNARVAEYRRNTARIAAASQQAAEKNIKIDNLFSDSATFGRFTLDTAPLAASASADTLLFGVNERGVFAASDDDGDGFADGVRFFFKQRIFPTNVASVADVDGTVFVTDQDGKLYRLTDPNRNGIADQRWSQFFVPAIHALLPLGSRSVRLGSIAYPNILDGVIDASGQNISTPSSSVTPGTGLSAISMAQGSDGSLYMVDIQLGVTWHIPIRFGAILDWGHPEIITSEYPRAVRIASDGAGGIYLAVAGQEYYPQPPQIPGVGTLGGGDSEPVTSDVSKIVVFREIGSTAKKVEEIPLTFGGIRIDFSPWSGLAVSRGSIYTISTRWQDNDLVSEIFQVKMVGEKRSVTTYLSRYDIGTGSALAGLDVRKQKQ